MENKLYKCLTCGETGKIDKFVTKKLNGRIYASKCKKCRNKKRRENERTKEGIITRMYQKQKYSSKQRGYAPPNYSRIDLIEWCLCQDKFHELYDDWKNSGYELWSKPSIDRINDYKPYTLYNIRITTWKQNNEKYHSDAKNGINTKSGKPVIQLTKDGRFIRKYYSIHNAGRETGIKPQQIWQCCNNRQRAKSAHGYIFKYANINDVTEKWR